LAPATSALLSNAMCAPSGDQAGAESNAPATSKTVVRPAPSASITWIARSVSSIADIVVANRILVMSGDQLG